MKIWDGLKRFDENASALIVNMWLPTMNWLPMTCCSVVPGTVMLMMSARAAPAQRMAAAANGEASLVTTIYSLLPSSAGQGCHRFLGGAREFAKMSGVATARGSLS